MKNFIRNLTKLEMFLFPFYVCALGLGLFMIIHTITTPTEPLPTIKKTVERSTVIRSVIVIYFTDGTTHRDYSMVGNNSLLKKGDIVIIQGDRIVATELK